MKNNISLLYSVLLVLVFSYPIFAQELGVFQTTETVLSEVRQNIVQMAKITIMKPKEFQTYLREIIDISFIPQDKIEQVKKLHNLAIRLHDDQIILSAIQKKLFIVQQKLFINKEKKMGEIYKKSLRDVQLDLTRTTQDIALLLSSPGEIVHFLSNDMLKVLQVSEILRQSHSRRITLLHILADLRKNISKE